MMYDAHVHLTEPEFSILLDIILGVCQQVQIKCMCVSTNIQTSKKTPSLAKNRPTLVVPFVEVHPRKVRERETEAISSPLDSPGVKDVGEIGLDGRASKEKNEESQISAFTSQLELAERSRLPVSVHSRDVTKVVPKTLSSFRIKSVLMHWFNGEPAELNTAQGRGYYVSFGPSLLYSKRSMELAAEADSHLVLVESDGPVAYGNLFGGRPATPIAVPSVIHKLAGIWRKHHTELRLTLEANARTYLGEG